MVKLKWANCAKIGICNHIYSNMRYILSRSTRAYGCREKFKKKEFLRYTIFITDHCLPWTRFAYVARSKSHSKKLEKAFLSFLIEASSGCSVGGGTPALGGGAPFIRPPGGICWLWGGCCGGPLWGGPAGGRTPPIPWGTIGDCWVTVGGICPWGRAPGPFMLIPAMGPLEWGGWPPMPGIVGCCRGGGGIGPELGTRFPGVGIGPVWLLEGSFGDDLGGWFWRGTGCLACCGWPGKWPPCGGTWFPIGPLLRSEPGWLAKPCLCFSSAI